MGKFLDYFKKDQLTEEIKAFDERPKPKLVDIIAKRGEGWESTQDMNGVGNVGVQSFNLFYNSYINKQYENEVNKIHFYRQMSNMPEIADVIEDAVNESTQVDEDGALIHLEIKDKDLSSNENIVKNINSEFYKLFNKNIKTETELWNMFRNYFIDGRIYYERIIDSRHPKQGIIGIKTLPSETMDYIYNPISGKISSFFQYLKPNSKRPLSLEEAKSRKDIVLFNENQIGFINYGIYGASKYEIFGFLEKSKVPYNQLKLLETSVIIYRIIRAPERLVFKIDTGNMPRDKSLKYTEKVKSKMTKKQSYNSTTGELSQEPEILCIRKNTEIPLLDGRYLTLEEIIKEYNDGKENWVYSINEKTKNIEPGKIINAKITRKNEKLIRIWLDNENYIDTTYDHKFITRDGSKCRADKLKVGQSLMPLYKKKEKIRSNVKNEYEMVYNPLDNKWKWTHNIVSSFFNGKKEKGFVDHHKDFNPFNNNPNNLIRMHHKKHSTMHSECVKKAWKENYDFMYDAICRGRQTLKNNEILLNKMKDKLKKNWNENYDNRTNSIKNGTKEWHSKEENKKRHSEWVIKTNIEQNKAAAMQKVLNTPEIREKQKEAVRVSKKEWFENEDNKKNFSKKKTIRIDDYFVGMVSKMFLEENRPIRNDLIYRVNKNKMLIKYLELLNKDRCPRSNFVFNRNILSKVVDRLGFNDYADYRLNFAKILNHKVSKIEYLSETDDTGCIEVEGNHNFAVSRNSQPLVFIRNSMLENYYLPQCLRTNTLVDLLDGRKITLDNLIKEHNEGKKHEVFSIDQKTGKIIRGKVEWAGITRKNAELMRVWLDSNEYIDCTPDHKFVMRDGNEIEAQNLKSGDSLMPLYRRKEKTNFIPNHKVLRTEILPFKEDTGCLTIRDLGENHNFGLSVGIFVKNSADGRGSSIESVGGNASGFTELDDVYYFARKLYRALKYPSSRVSAGQEKNEGDIVFGGSSTGEITRDEIKWSKFLERQQRKFCEELTNLFLLHLDFKGLKKLYELDNRKININLNSPSKYKEQMEANFIESRHNNYSSLADREEMSKYYCMKKYLKWDDEEIQANRDGMKKDIEYGFRE